MLLFLGIMTYFTIQNYRAQTWLTQRAAAWFSEKIHSRVQVKKVAVDFLSNIIIEGIYLEDLHKDTLLYLDKLSIGIDDFDYEKQQVRLGDISVENSKAAVVYYRNDTDFNFAFIEAALRQKHNVRDTAGWKVEFGDIYLRNIDFIYRDERDTMQSRGIDFENLHCSNLNGYFQGLNFSGDTISVEIRNLTAKERSGFILRKFMASAKISPVSLRLNNLFVITNESDIRTNLLLTYKQYDDYNHFVHKIKMNARFDSSIVQMKDIGYFAPELRGFDKKVILTGNLSGSVDNLKGNEMYMVLDANTHFMGNFSFTGLPDIEETFMSITIKELTTTKKEVERMPVPPYDSTHFVTLSKNMELLGKVKYKGKITGYYYDLVSDGVFSTALGTVGTNLELNQNTKDGMISYSGKLWSKDFNVGKLTASEKILGKVTMKADVNGSGLRLPTLQARLKNCNIENIEFNGYNYKNIAAEGFLAKKIFNGKMKIKDENVDMTFNGDIDMTRSPVKLHFKSQVNQADLVALKLVKSTKHITVATTIDVDITGDNIDNIIGRLNLTNSAYIQDKDFYNVDKLELSVSGQGTSRKFEMHSDLGDIMLKGNIKIAAMGDAFTNVVSYYLPATTVKQKAGTHRWMPENFEYDIVLKNFDPLSHLFIPELTLATGTSFSGRFISDENNFQVNGYSDKIKYKGTELIGWKLNSTADNGRYDFSMGCKQYVISDSVRADNPHLQSIISNDTLGFLLTWRNNSKANNYGSLKGDVNFSAYPEVVFRFTDAEVMINDSLWEVSKNNRVTFDSAGIMVKSLSFSSRTQFVKVDGTVSKNKEDKLFITLNDFNIGNLNVLTKSLGFELSGSISGNGDFSNLYDPSNLTFSSNFDFDKIYINSEEIGTGAVVSKYDKHRESMSLNGSFKRGELPFISFNGFYYPSKEKESLDLQAEINEFKTDLIRPFIKDICDPFVGTISAKMNIKGEPAAPLLSGTGEMNLQKVRLNYLNTFYSLRGPFTIENNSFGVENLKIVDLNGKTASVTGHVYHTNFRHVQLDLDIMAEKFCMLNTTILDNSLYYGKLFASGIVNISGFVENNIQIDASLKTEKVLVPGKGVEYSRFYLPLSGPSEVSDNSFITFVKKDSAGKKDENYNMNLSGLVLNLQLETTPDVEAEIIFDEKVGDIIRAKGNGDIILAINTNGNFSIYGEYEITNGDYLFTLQNILNKHFQIAQGGTIKWAGDPYSAEINMNAVYVAKAALKPFFPEDSTQIYKKRVRTECVMHLTGPLLSPFIDFDINLPTVDASTAQTVKSYISTQQEMNQQIFTLLVLNSFTTPDALKGQGGTGLSGATAAGVTTSELLSNQLSNMLSQVSKSFDLGVNYRPGDNISREQVELLMSKNFFNDRLIIESTVGNNPNVSAQNSSTVVGDVNVDYKVRDDGKVRLKAYNKTNDNLILNPDAQYKQGVGIYYREEFNTLGELYRRYLNRVRGKSETGGS